MTELHELARQSGLAFADSDDNSSHTPQWNANDWPPLLGGWRCGHATVVLDHPQDDCAQTVVVLGGHTNCARCTSSILQLNLNEENMEWREGPPLNESRCGHAAVVCNGGVYAIGGTGIGGYAHPLKRTRDAVRLDCIERIDVEDLLEASSVARGNWNQWITLNCRLSTSRVGCCAVAVYNRYIVVIGGSDDENAYLSSVDIIDTAIQSNHTIISGPSMTVPRTCCASVVIDHCIFVVDGNNSTDELASVESLKFEERSHDETNETACTVFPSSAAWTTCTDQTLSSNVAVVVGSCIIGGASNRYMLELFDTESNIVWNLPPLNTYRQGYRMVAFNTGIAVIGGWNLDSCETLPLSLSEKERVKVRFVAYCTLESLALSDIIRCFYNFQKLYSCREEIDTEMKNLQNVIDRAQIERTDITVLQEGAKAQELYSILQSLCTDEKYRSIEHIQDEINSITSQLDRMNVIRDKIPLVEKLKKLESQLELRQLTQNDRKLPGHPVRSTRHMDSCVSDDAFYRKLVEVDCDDIVFKVHDLALLVCDVHQMKAFYIFLSHLYRSKRISKDDRQRYTKKALQQTFKSIDKIDQQAVAMRKKIVDKCRQDGVLVSGIDNHQTDSVAAITDSMSALPNKLAMTEFRVGEILPLTYSQSPETTNTESDSIGHRVVLSQAQALGRSLKDVYAALDAKDENGASTGAICSVLNALSFGQTIFRHVSSETLATCVLDEIVDFGDVNHICSVVYQCGKEKLQHAFQQGIAIVERAEDEAAREQDKVGMSILVSVMGHLANAVTNWIREVKPMEAHDMPENAEAISLLALVVTAKVIQAVTEESLEVEQDAPSQDKGDDGEQIIPSHDKVGSAHASKRTKRKGALSFPSGEGSSAIVTEIVEKGPLTIFLSRLVETTVEGATAVVQPMTRMEESMESLCRASSLLSERMTRLEESMSSLMDKLKGKNSSDERTQAQMEQLERRLCQLEESQGDAEHVTARHGLRIIL